MEENKGFHEFKSQIRHGMAPFYYSVKIGDDSTEYTFKSFMKANVGDVVIVSTIKGNILAEVVREVTDYDTKSKATAFILGLIDEATLDKFIQQEQRKSELVELMDKRIKELQRPFVYAWVAQGDYQMKTYYDEWYKLMNES